MPVALTKEQARCPTVSTAKMVAALVFATFSREQSYLTSHLINTNGVILSAAKDLTSVRLGLFERFFAALRMTILFMRWLVELSPRDPSLRSG